MELTDCVLNEMFAPKLSTGNGRKETSEICKATAGARDAGGSACGSCGRNGVETPMGSLHEVTFAETDKKITMADVRKW